MNTRKFKGFGVSTVSRPFLSSHYCPHSDRSISFIIISRTYAIQAVEENTDAYFNRVNAAGLKNPKLIGFNIKDNETFSNACKHAEGAIIGSAFIKVLQRGGVLEESIPDFVKSVRG